MSGEFVDSGWLGYDDRGFSNGSINYGVFRLGEIITKNQQWKFGYYLDEISWQNWQSLPSPS